jgi:hypothetical protein
MSVVCLFSWHAVISMYRYSFTFNQEDKLVGWIHQPVSDSCPRGTLLVCMHILGDSNS